MLNTISIPTILKYGNIIADQFQQILKNHNIYFDNIYLVTEKYLFDIYKKKLPEDLFEDVIFIESSDFNTVKFLEKQNIKKKSLIVAFGGGKVIDIVKLFSSNNNFKYFIIPSTLSHDGIYSPIARIDWEGKKTSFGVKTPIGILMDQEIIRNSPKRNILAGTGDLISNLSALEDWKLANINDNEEINDFSYSLSYLSCTSILPFKEHQLMEGSYLKKLAYGLVISGLAMEISGDSRPASGAEHQISHAIDELYPERATLHGIQVAYGCLLLDEHRNGTLNDMKGFIHDIGLYKIIKKECDFDDNEIKIILDKAKKIRNRYTILKDVEMLKTL